MPEDGLAQALVAMVDQMRGEARMMLETFLLSGKHEYGGVLKIQAPCSVRKRPRYEVGFKSERCDDI